MHGRGARLVSFEGRNSRHQLPVAAADRFLEPGRRLAGRRGEGNPVRRGEPELDEQGHDRGRDGGLAGAGTARDHAEPAACRGAGRPPGTVVRGRAREEPIERGIEPARLGRRSIREVEELGGDARLRRPHPLEIEPAPAVEDERAALRVFGPGDHRARIERRDPCIEVGEAHPARPGPVPARDLGQRDAGVSVPGPRAGKRRRQRQLRPAVVVQLGDERREVPVDVRDMAPLQQDVQRLRRGGGPGADGSGTVARPASAARGTRRFRHVPPPRKQPSSASRHSALGRSKCTPRRMPAAGSMPRTKR